MYVSSFSCFSLRSRSCSSYPPPVCLRYSFISLVYCHLLSNKTHYLFQAFDPLFSTPTSASSNTSTHSLISGANTSSLPHMTSRPSLGAARLPHDTSLQFPGEINGSVGEYLDPTYCCA